MRINKYLALASGLSRRKADEAVAAGRVTINGAVAILGTEVAPAAQVTLDSRPIAPPVKCLTIILHKPAGYVVSRAGQGSRTIYDLLPSELHSLKPVGRLDKDSSGLLLLTNDGALANRLTHPSFHKIKIYEVTLDSPLTADDQAKIEQGVMLEDGISRLRVKQPITGAQAAASDRSFVVSMHEGRNRQIRRTFAALGCQVTRLHRTHFGDFALGSLPTGQYQTVRLLA